MIEPQRAPVTPRVICPDTGDVIPLEQAIPPLEGMARGAIEIVGGPGSGKTTALAHLEAVSPVEEIHFLDQPDAERVARESAAGPVVYTSVTPQMAVAAESFYLAPWTDDDLIEYLLAVHPDQCGSVMGRVSVAEHRRWLLGIPQLWRIVLDEMARDPSVTDLREPLRRHWRSSVADESIDELGRRYCLASLTDRAQLAEKAAVDLCVGGCDPRLMSLLRHRLVRVTLAAQHLAGALAGARECRALIQRLPRDLIGETSEQIASCQSALDYLHRLVEGDERIVHPMAASVLHATGCGWQPECNLIPCLRGAYLQGACWAGVDLSKAELEGADLIAADLTEAKLDYAVASRASLRDAALRRASMNRVVAAGADLTRADLSEASGWGADFVGACLSHANFEGAKLVNADFRKARLTGTCFHACDLRHAKFVGATVEGTDFTEASLRWATFRGLNLQTALFSGASMAEVDFSACSLECVDLPEANLEGAFLAGAYLTGSSMPKANLRRARLRGAGLARVHWEGGDLRDADMRGCSFHLGSSRSGRVGSPIAGEGSRTGFYTDEFDEQHYRSPEEIRKANLRGADLRGAQIQGVDFYLVDLRDVRCTIDQMDHFRRTGAILYDRG